MFETCKVYLKRFGDIRSYKNTAYYPVLSVLFCLFVFLFVLYLFVCLFFLLLPLSITLRS